MKVELLHNTPLTICATAIRTCWQSQDKSDSNDGICGDNDKALIDRVGNKFKHASTLEHISYNFYISGVSRALLQELARHRMASLSVKSTRYTLKELKETGSIDYEKFLVMTGNEMVDNASKQALDNVQKILQSNVSNDIAKYCLPESYKTELTWTINARSLQNFLHLRTNKAALWEIRDLAYAIYKELPEEHKYLFEDCISELDVTI
jgi:thymidylate synthase (FAD)